MIINAIGVPMLILSPFGSLLFTGSAHAGLSAVRRHRYVNRVRQLLGLDVLRYLHGGVVSDALYEERR